MKNLFILMLVFFATFQVSKAQEIIPFPDLSESHVAINNQTDVIDNYNYSLYTKDYQDALKKMDLDIEELQKKIDLEEDIKTRQIQQVKKEELIKQRILLIQEAELLEDLNKFY